MNIYKKSKEEIVKLLNMTKQYNLLNSKITKSNDDKAKIDFKKRRDPNELYKYICDLESHDIDQQFPTKKMAIRKLNILYRKYFESKLKVNYYENCLLPNNHSDKKKQISLTKQLVLIKKHSNILHDEINSMLSSAGMRFLARQVGRLDRMKKTLIGPKTSKHAIDLKGVVKYYSNGTLALKVLKDIDLEINYGEFVVILGPSGSGKTTLLNIISGMDKATYGRTMIAGVDLINKNSSQLTKFRKENLGYIFQQYGLLPNLTVRENVEIGANLQKDKNKRMDIDELLKTIGIFEHASNFPHELSGGQQQRVSIARSMAKNPTLIFGDEPTGAIDEEMSKHIMQLFVDINKKFKTTVIIVTHNPILAGLATTIIKVNNGKIANIIKNKTPKQVNELE
jgi:putative ABC transport system ATP-binding protein